MFYRLLCTCCLLAGALAAGAETLDPVVISPDHYKLRFENEYVRVVEYRIRPGERESWHIHPAKVSYVLSGGRLRITTESGESFITEEQTGSVRWMDAVGKHYGENIGDTPVHILLVEIKGAGGQGMDLDDYLREQTNRFGLL